MAKATKSHEHRQPRETPDDKERNVVPATYGNAGRVAQVPAPNRVGQKNEWMPAADSGAGRWPDQDAIMRDVARHDYCMRPHDQKANAPAQFNANSPAGPVDVQVEGLTEKDKKDAPEAFNAQKGKPFQKTGLTGERHGRTG